MFPYQLELCNVFSHSYHLHPNLHLYLPVSERQEHEKKKGRENQN